MMPDQMLFHIHNETQRDLKVEKGMYKSVVDLIDGMKQSKTLISELELLKGSLVPFESLEYLKQLQKEDILKVLELNKMSVELQLNISKKRDIVYRL
ncbi:hypothetical protein Tco_0107347 [Tanacetum coccineum]